MLVVATVQTFKPYADLKSYAVAMFENHGKGIGTRKGDNGALVVLAVDDRQVWIEVGYGLEGFVTDGFAGETSRDTMVPFFRRGDYGQGLLAGATRVAQRIAQGRNVTISGRAAATPNHGAAGRQYPHQSDHAADRALHPLSSDERAAARAAAALGRRGARWSSGAGPVGPVGGWGGSRRIGAARSGGFGGFGGRSLGWRRRRSVVVERKPMKKLIRLVAVWGCCSRRMGRPAARTTRFVSQEETIKTQWAQVENQLQRRNDLIPNLVETAKGFAQQERDVFRPDRRVAGQAGRRATPEQRMAAANEQSSALSRLLVVVENYPELKTTRPSRG